VFTEIMTGKVETDTIASFLLNLKEKGETVDEITGAARVMRKFATKITPKRQPLLDTCGTGGDSANTFNISTVSAFVAAAAGCVVAKHGNRAVSSKCGSADLLESLGVNIDVGREVVERCIDEIGIGFLFARNLHLAMKYAGPARKLIKTRSIFNILGPLTNPAAAEYQLLGVYDKSLLEPVINVLKKLGSKKALVVHGNDGLDEITTTDSTTLAELAGSAIKIYEVKPEDFGLKRALPKALKGGDVNENAKIALEILKGKKGFKRDIVVINAAACVYIAGLAGTLAEGIKISENAIDSGKALEKLQELKKITRE
ncbi:MAG: anthranilate phosphoribosyltransferase, partial [Candidatus Omnitrophica bacterium]|nr:anthranilate phosphoribosyltransferase [Candidatus Omnitrophota bacterium]